MNRKTIIDELNKALSDTRTGEIERLKEIGGFESFGINNSDNIFPNLSPFIIINKKNLSPEEEKKNLRESMKFSLWNIYNESFFAYLFGFERLCILGCRAVVERGLRISYQDKTNRIAGKKWSLGPLIKNCEEINIDKRIIDLANIVKKEGDNLSHAKYEVKYNWDGLIMKNTKKNPVGAPTAHYHTGNSKNALIATRDFLKQIFK